MLSLPRLPLNVYKFIVLLMQGVFPFLFLIKKVTYLLKYCTFCARITSNLTLQYSTREIRKPLLFITSNYMCMNGPLLNIKSVYTLDGWYMLFQVITPSLSTKTSGRKQHIVSIDIVHPTDVRTNLIVRKIIGIKYTCDMIIRNESI